MSPTDEATLTLALALMASCTIGVFIGFASAYLYIRNHPRRS